VISRVVEQVKETAASVGSAVTGGNDGGKGSTNGGGQPSGGAEL
jgi:hypothetical protein